MSVEAPRDELLRVFEAERRGVCPRCRHRHFGGTCYEMVYPSRGPGASCLCEYQREVSQ